MLRRLVWLTMFVLLLRGSGRSEPCTIGQASANDQQICRSINEAARQTDTGNPETALAILKDVPADAEKEPALAALVRSERIRAQREAAIEAKRNAGAFRIFLSGLTTKLTTLLSWLALLAIAAAILLALAQIPRRRAPLPTTLLSFIDQSEGKSSDASNLALTYDVNRLLNPPAATGSDDIIQQTPGDGHGTTFIDLQPLLGASSFATALGSAADVDLGGFKISSKAVIQAWKAAVRPTYRFTLRGVLSRAGETTIVYAQMLDSKGRPVKDEEWSASAQGAGARDAALREVMARVTICHSSEKPVTQVWQSLSFFWQAMDLSRDDMSPETLTVAQGLLQQSLKHDPLNWMARYNNALFLQIIGNYKAALENWTFLLTELIRGHVQTGVGEQGRAPLLAKVKYNRALTLARMGDWNELKLAVVILQELLTDDALELKWLAKSAMASALSTLHGLMLESEEESRAKKKIDADAKGRQENADSAAGSKSQSPTTKVPAKASAPEQLREQVDVITKELIAQLESGDASSRSLLLANAVARNARGAVLLDMSQYSAALKDFDAAILLNPDLVEPQLNAARAVRRQKGKDWSLQAEAYLQTALKLDGRQREAHFRLGSLYLDPAVYRLKDAATQFELANPHSWAAFELGGLYTKSQFGVPDDTNALEWYRRSVRLGDAVDIRAVTLVHKLLEVARKSMDAKQRAATAGTEAQHLPSDYELTEMLSEAEQVAKRIQRRAKRAQDTRKAADLARQARDLAVTLQSPPATQVESPEQPAKLSAEKHEDAELAGQKDHQVLQQGNNLSHDGNQV